MKPLIGITTFSENRSGKVLNVLNYNYINSIYLAGGIPLALPVIDGESEIKRYLDIIDGIMFTGGNDISPMLYGENPIKEVTSISEDRDKYEYVLFNEAYARDIPVLGICRGVQLMNAAAGGTLYQDINVQHSDTLGHSPVDTTPDNLYHTVSINRDSRLFNIFNTEILKVNSYHHQSVKIPGKGFKVTAVSPDGIIESIENENKAFMIGVQWHPEGLIQKHPEFLKLFEAFMQAAQSFKGRNPL